MPCAGKACAAANYGELARPAEIPALRRTTVPAAHDQLAKIGYDDAEAVNSNVMAPLGRGADGDPIHGAANGRLGAALFRPERTD